MKRSTYMEWAKTQASAEFDLATSGVKTYALEKLDFNRGDLSLNAPVGYGYPPLTGALAAKCNVSPDCIVTAIGTTFANHIAMAALLDRGDHVVIERPAYEPLVALAKYVTGCEPSRFDRRFDDDFCIDLNDLRRGVTPKTRLIILTNLHNPTSAFVDERTLREIQDIAAGAGARVLVDEVYLEVLDVFGERVRSSFHLGKEFVVTSSLTKAYGLSGLRCGWIIAEPELAKRMWRLLDLFYATAPHIDERLSVVAIQQLRRIAGEVRSLLQTNRVLLNGFLDSRDDLETIRPKYGTTVFPRLRQGSVEQLCVLLRDKYRTSVVPGDQFEAPDHFRIGIGGDTTLVANSLERLGLALDELNT